MPCRPHLNFISGENGSGKSAALQCLQVCLGVQARLTGRAKTGKELINDSSSVATAKVVLWNTVRALLCCAIYPCAVNSQSMLQGQYKHCLPVLLLWHLLGVLCQLSCWPEPLMMYCRGMKHTSLMSMALPSPLPERSGDAAPLSTTLASMAAR